MAVTKFSLVINEKLWDVFSETLLEVNKNHQLITWTRDYTDGDKHFLTLFHRTTKDLFLFAEIWGKNKCLLEIARKGGSQ